MPDRPEADVMRDMFIILSPQQDGSIHATVNKLLQTVASHVQDMDPSEEGYQIAKNHVARLGYDFKF
jgi:hypothetical protein